MVLVREGEKVGHHVHIAKLEDGMFLVFEGVRAHEHAYGPWWYFRWEKLLDKLSGLVILVVKCGVELDGDDEVGVHSDVSSVIVLSTLFARARDSHAPVLAVQALVLVFRTRVAQVANVIVFLAKCAAVVVVLSPKIHPFVHLSRGTHDKKKGDRSEVLPFF